MVWLIEAGLALAVLWVLGEQVALPLWQGRPLFPLFRRRAMQGWVEREMERLNEEARVQALHDEFKARREALTRHRAGTTQTTKGERNGDEQAV